ncbi:MAG: DUF2089 family protein [Pirellulales bacterium]
MSRVSENAASPETHSARRHPLKQLTAEEQELVLQLVLGSGSLKDVARHYGVSYPTIRARLDRLIDRVRRFIENRPVDPMAELLASLVESQQLVSAAAQQVLATHRELASKQSEGKEP